MEENVRQELQALEMMLYNWKRSYLRDATPDGNNDFLVEEFLNFCDCQVDDLRGLIREVENPSAEPGVWQKVVQETRITWRNES